MAFPRVVSIGVSLPLYKVLKITVFPKVLVIDDGLNFKLLFFINDVWGWSQEVVTILGSLLEWRQEAGMKDVMDGPGWGQFQSGCNIRDHAADVKGAVAFGREFQ